MVRSHREDRGHEVGPGLPGHQHSGLLARQRSTDLGEGFGQDAVHRTAHVFDPATEEELHPWFGVRRRELGDLPEGVEALGQLPQDDRGAGEQLRGQ